MARRYSGSGIGSFGPGPASGTSGYGGSPSYGDQQTDLSGYVRDEDLVDYTTQADLDAATQGFATQDDIDAAVAGSAIDRDALIQDILDQVFAGGDMGAFDDPMGMGGMGQSEITQIVEDWIANNAGTLTDQQMRDYVDAELISEERIQELVADGTLSQEQVDQWIDTAIEEATSEFMTAEEIEAAIADGSLTPEQIQELIEQGSLSTEQIQELIAQEMLSEDQISRLIQDQVITQEQVDQWIADATSGFMTAEEIDEAIANGTLTAEDVQQLIDDGLLDDEHIQSLIAQEMLSEDQIARLIQDQVITQEQVDQWIADATGDFLTPEQIDEMIASGTLTPEEIQNLLDTQVLSEEQILELVRTEQLSEEQVAALVEAGTITQEDIDQILGTTLDDYATLAELEERLAGYLTPEQLAEFGYLTQEEMLAQGYLTPDQLAEYGYLTQEEFQAGLPNMEDYDQVIGDLQTQLGSLEDKYANAQTQYEADAAQEQIEQTRGELDSYFDAAQPSGPRTGSTSEFEAVEGSSPMSNLIGQQRASAGQDPYTSYLQSFTPTYSDWEQPMSMDDLSSMRGPGPQFDYPNPFFDQAPDYTTFDPWSGSTVGGTGSGTGSGGTIGGGTEWGGGVGSYNQGGAVNQPQQSTMLNGNSLVDQRPNQNNQGIMGALNFQTNVAPFQNAFRPNVKRNR